MSTPKNHLQTLSTPKNYQQTMSTPKHRIQTLSTQKNHHLQRMSTPKNRRQKVSTPKNFQRIFLLKEAPRVIILLEIANSRQTISDLRLATATPKPDPYQRLTLSLNRRQKAVMTRNVVEPRTLVTESTMSTISAGGLLTILIRIENLQADKVTVTTKTKHTATETEKTLHFITTNARDILQNT
jgi:hypothetical protein